MIPNSKWQRMIVDTWKPEKKGDTVEGEIFIMETIQIREDIVPYIELITQEGEPIRIQAGAYALQKAFYNPVVREGGYLAVRFDGESTTIKKAQNFAKLFSLIYYEPGKWSYGETGEVIGTPTNVRTVESRRILPLVEKASQETNPSYADYPQDDSPIDFTEPVPGSDGGIANEGIPLEQITAARTATTKKPGKK